MKFALTDIAEVFSDNLNPSTRSLFLHFSQYTPECIF